jgi:hypothetical protein
MARIRTIKPEFFRHEAIQDLEAENQGSYVMLVFAALWGHCDSNGVFEYRPRQLKLDILPFLDFSMQSTLELLVSAGFIKKYKADGKEYGFIKSFKEHQRLTGKEANDGVKFPFIENIVEEQQVVEGEVAGKQQGNIGEIPDAQEKEKEKEKEGNRKGYMSAPAKAVARPKAKKPNTTEYFEKFWIAYPKKVARSDAEKAWAKGNCDAMAEIIIADVMVREMKHKGWQDKQYIPHASTYLNGQRWTDDIIEQTAKPSSHTGFATKNYSAGATQLDPDDWAARIGGTA